MFLTLLAGAVLGISLLRAEGPTTKRPAPVFVSGGAADQAEGRQALEAFRAAGIAGTYWLEFDLRVIPRNGAERTVRGQIFGTRGAQGPLTRLSLAIPEGAQSWLIQSGAKPASWEQNAGQPAPRALTAAESLQPIAGTDLTLFDLQMPFLYWADFVYEGIAKVRSRPAHSFILYPPAELAAARPELGAVRVALDTQFQALVQAEMLDPKGDSLKSITVLDLKKVGEEWFVKSIDLRNRATRDKTRFEATAAVLKLTLPAAVFSPESLGTPVTLPEGTKIERF